MGSKRRHEGYLMLDHRGTEGVPDEVMRSCGLPAGSGHKLYECPSFTCSHCQRVVIMDARRTNSRGYCKKCDHYVCDNCETIRVASGGMCKTFSQQVDELLNAAEKQATTQDPRTIVLPD